VVHVGSLVVGLVGSDCMAGGVNAALQVCVCVCAVCTAGGGCFMHWKGVGWVFHVLKGGGVEAICIARGEGGLCIASGGVCTAKGEGG